MPIWISTNNFIHKRLFFYSKKANLHFIFFSPYMVKKNDIWSLSCFWLIVFLLYTTQLELNSKNFLLVGLACIAFVFPNIIRCECPFPFGQGIWTLASPGHNLTLVEVAIPYIALRMVGQFHLTLRSVRQSLTCSLSFDNFILHKRKRPLIFVIGGLFCRDYSCC